MLRCISRVCVYIYIYIILLIFIQAPLLTKDFPYLYLKKIIYMGHTRTVIWWFVLLVEGL